MSVSKFCDRYIKNITNYVYKHSNHGIKTVCFFPNFNRFLTKKEIKDKHAMPLAFISDESDEVIIYINKKNWPIRHAHMCQGILLHEIGHLKDGLYGGQHHKKELNAQLWAIKKAKRLKRPRVARWLLLNLFLWGLQKNFSKIYRQASKVAYKRGIINRKTMNNIFIGTKESLDVVYADYCKTIKSVKL